MRRRPRRTALTAAAIVALVATLVGCAPEEAEPVVAATPTAAPQPAADTSTIRTMIDSPEETPEVEVIGDAPTLQGESSTQVAYTSGEATVTGVVRVPEGEGPFPAVVVVHGSVDPDAYVTGADLLPEQRALLDAGFVVFALDLRGFADSDPADIDGSMVIDPGFGWDTVLDWGMAWDVVNALRAVRAGEIADADPDRVGLLGHSLGGLLALDAAVIAPGTSDGIVTLAAASSNTADLVEKEVEPGSDEHDQLLQMLGTPDTNPDYWADISPATFVDRATEPLLLIHGSADDATLAEWSEQTAQLWRDAGLQAEALIIDGTGHLFRGARTEVDGIVVAAFESVIGD